MFLIGIWQRSMELTCLGIELLEEGDVHRCDLAMMNAREVGTETG